MPGASQGPALCPDASQGPALCPDAGVVCSQAKAGFVEEAFATLAEMQRPPQLIKPDHFVCNTLVNACSRSSPPCPAEAMRVVEEIMPRYKLVPDRCPHICMWY